jgi:hypothetical protein
MTSLFRTVLGAPFDSLPAPIRTIHHGYASRRFEGSCRVERGTSWLSRLCAAVSSLPVAADSTPVCVTIRADGNTETWERDFGGRKMRSCLRHHDGLLEETLGPTTFRFELAAESGAIEWRVVGVRLFGIPLPTSWFRRISARESLERGRYRFDVRAELPIAGLLVHYEGTLDVGA